MLPLAPTPDDPRRVAICKDGEVTTLRLMSDWVYVVLHPQRKQIGSILLPDSVPGDLHTGTVVARGPGKYMGDNQVPVGVEPGEVVVFHRWNLEHKSGKAINQYVEDGAGLIRGTDILVVFPPGSEPEIW